MSSSRFKWVILWIISFLFLSYTSLYAQLRLGPQTLLSMEAPTLRNPQHLSIALQSQSFFAAVGGVAFDQIAEPDKDLRVNDLSLQYRAEMPDGNRLWLTVNGERISAHIYDWQLIPTAKFVDSPYYSCFTLFGKLTDPAKEKEVLDKDGKILNYHPALVNTLLGLRIFQLDILILYDFVTDLPKDDDKYILGSGESIPDIRMNQIGMRLFHYYLNNIQSEFKHGHRSYLICDFGQSVRFNLRGSTLNITGQPYYYLWRYKFDQPGYDQRVASANVLEQIKQGMEDEKRSSPGTFDERNWLVEALVLQAKEYQDRYLIYSSGAVVDLVNIKDDDSRRSFLSRCTTKSLHEMLVHMRVAMDAHKVVYLKEYSELISSKPYLLRDINPVIWDATVNFMRYSAFFRFCKNNFPEKWQRFMQQIEKAFIDPQVVTPTVMPGTQKDKKR